MKRRISLLLAVVMVLGSFGAVFASDAVMTEEQAGKFLEEKGVLKGNTVGDLELEKNLLRRDSVVMLSRLMGDEEEAKGHVVTEAYKAFKDITDQHYKGYISWAVEKEYFQGHSATKFGFNENITVRDYSVVLLRALGYGEEVKGNEGWKAAFEKAKELGLLNGLEVKADDEILRGQMSLMTVNALNTKVKGSDKTLAQELAIEMPKPEVLEAVVTASNLKEITVKFNRDMDRDVAEKVMNYSTTAGAGVKEARLLEDNQTVILTVNEQMVNSREFKLNIRGIDANVNKEYKFQVIDNAAPTVVEVVGLGTNGIKVVMSEPVKDATQNKFKVDGRNFYGNVEVLGSELLLSPYSGTFAEGDHVLTVGSLTDYANFKSVASEHNLTIVKDAEGPEVVDVKLNTEKVVVTFNKPVTKRSVAVGNIFVGDSNIAANRPTKATLLSGNRVEYDFSTKGLLGNVKLTISGVENYSGVAMKAHEGVYRVELDESRPEVVDFKFEEDTRTITLTFNKNLKEQMSDGSFKLFNAKNEEVKNALYGATLVGTDKVTLKVATLVDLSKAHTLKVSGLRDKTVLGNSMVPFERELVGSAKADVEVEDARHIAQGSDDYKEAVRIIFNREMDLADVTNVNNYILKGVKTSVVDGKEVIGSEAVTKRVSDIEGAYIVPGRNLKEVIINMPGNTNRFDKYMIMAQLKDVKGNTLNTKYFAQEKDFTTPVTDFKATEANVIDAKVVEFVFGEAKVSSVLDAKKFTVNKANPTKVEVKDGKVVATFEADVLVEETTVSVAKDAVTTIAGDKNVASETTLKLEDKIAPVIKTIDNNKTNNKITVTFDRNVKGSSDAVKASLAVTLDGKTVNAKEVVVKDDTIVLTLNETLKAGNVVGVKVIGTGITSAAKAGTPAKLMETEKTFAISDVSAGAGAEAPAETEEPAEDKTEKPAEDKTEKPAEDKTEKPAEDKTEKAA